MLEGFISIGEKKLDIIQLGCNINKNGQGLILTQKHEEIPKSIKDIQQNFLYTYEGFLDNGCDGCIESIRESCMNTLIKDYINNNKKS